MRSSANKSGMNAQKVFTTAFIGCSENVEYGVRSTEYGVRSLKKKILKIEIKEFKSELKE